MAATIQQIAELAGVSRGTVDRVLNGRGRVKPEVAEKIEQIAQEVGYVPKHPKKAESREASSTSPLAKKWRLGVITQLSQASFMIQINQGIRDIQERLERRGFEIILRESASVDESEQLAALEELEAEGIDGLAIMPVDCDSVRRQLMHLTKDCGIPVITFNTDIVGAGRQCFVGMDNRKCGRTAAGLMEKLTGGSGKILGITGNFANSVGSHRIDGFAEELKNSFPGMELVGVQSSFDHTDEVERIVLNSMAVYPDLKGIFVASGGQAGVRHAFEKLQPETAPHVILCDLTPKNIGLVNDNIADFILDQDGYQQGYKALSLLADQLQWGKKPQKEYLFTEIWIKTKYNI